MAFYGADVAQLRELAKQFDAAAGRLDGIQLGVGNRAQLRSWTGPVAGRFRTNWSAQHAPAIRRAADEIRRASQELRSNADEQQQASSGVDAAVPSFMELTLAVSAAKWWAKHIASGKSRFAPRFPGGEFANAKNMSFVDRLKAGWRGSGNWIAKPGQAAEYATWSKLASRLNVVGAVINGGIDGWLQWQSDASNPSLSTTARGARAAVVGGSSAAGALAGGALGLKAGAAIGFAVGGPVGAAFGAAVGGVAGSIIGSGVGKAVGDAVKDAAGKAAEKVGSWLSSLNPFK